LPVTGRCLFCRGLVAFEPVHGCCPRKVWSSKQPSLFSPLIR
jgi:hypothetical protein